MSTLHVGADVNLVLRPCRGTCGSVSAWGWLSGCSPLHDCRGGPRQRAAAQIPAGCECISDACLLEPHCLRGLATCSLRMHAGWQGGACLHTPTLASEPQERQGPKTTMAGVCYNVLEAAAFMLMRPSTCIEATPATPAAAQHLQRLPWHSGCGALRQLV